MPNNDSFQHAGPTSERQEKEYTIDLKKIFRLVFSRWYYFIITLILALLCSFLYNTLTIPTYKVSTTLLIDAKKRGISLETNQFIENFGLVEGAKNLDNQIMLLSSRTLIDRTLDDLNFYIEYYQRGLFNKIALYPTHLIKINPENTDSIPFDIEFRFKYIGNNMFNLYAESKDTFSLNTNSSFNEIIKFQNGSFRIDKASDDWPADGKYRKIYFINNSPRKLVESYRKRLKVESVSNNGTVLIIGLEGTNKTKDIEFLNKLAENFLNSSLDKKNEEAMRTIQFIDDQLIGISDSLIITENKLQQFRSRNRVMNLSAQGQVIIDQAMKLENERARLGIEANYYNYLADYLAKDNIGQAPIAPATIGIMDPGLTKLVTDLSDIQGQFYSKSLGEKNPLQSQLSQRLRNTKEALRETLNGVRRSNNLAMSEITDQIRTVNAQASALPVTERQLLGIERKYKLNDELYTFLLEKRAEAQIQKASNMPDNELIDPADSDLLPVRPQKSLIYFYAIFAGIIIPLLWILIADSFNNTVREDEDIRKRTDIPITGHIPTSTLRKNTVVFDEPRSHTAEAFRLLRSRMQFFTKQAQSPVILVTSSMPEEGKTFTAINLASAYSLIGKKTVLVGFDLRNPKIYADFGIGNEHGISTWLIGQDGLQDIIKKTSYENLFIISSGPIPPNPSELLALEKTDELINVLKEMFQCIIIDSSPIGSISDTFKLASLADTCILIVRQNVTLKSLLENTGKELKISDIKSVSIIVNDLKPKFKSYSRKYWYNYSKG